MTTIYTDKKDLPERKLNDVYPTEKDLIFQALSHVNLLSVGMILDIGAGDGRWGRTAKMLTKGEAQLCGSDVVGDCPRGFDRWDVGDYLEQYYENKAFDLIVSNPPYYIAEKVVRKAWVELAPGGEMVFLLRLSFQSGVDRANHLWQEIFPYKIGIVSRRPSFYDRGTNGTDYGVYYWRKGNKGQCFGTPGEWKTFLLVHQRDPLGKN
jgi:hypothetical protein